MWSNASDTLQRIQGLLELLLLLRVLQVGRIHMRMGMMSNLVSVADYLPNRFGMHFRYTTRNEETGFDPVSLKER